jgi:hypothetical protein
LLDNLKYEIEGLMTILGENWTYRMIKGYIFWQRNRYMDGWKLGLKDWQMHLGLW